MRGKAKFPEFARPRFGLENELIKSNGDDYTQEPPPFPSGAGNRVRSDGAIR
jgi:hypothetical protein